MNLVVAITVPLRYDENIKVFRGNVYEKKNCLYKSASRL